MIPDTAGLQALSLCDLGSLAKLGVKGPGAEGWLRGRGVDVPADTYDTRPLADGGLVARLGPGDFFLESGPSGEVVPSLAAGLAADAPQVYAVERQDATFLLGGPRAPDVLAQVGSFDFRSAPPGRLVLTRAAGVNCGVLPGEAGGAPAFRLWVDPTYAVSFWEALAEVVAEMGGACPRRTGGLACP
jgi:sarcosine oxidase subunit gamma